MSAREPSPICDGNNVDLHESISTRMMPSGTRVVIPTYVPMYIARAMELVLRRIASGASNPQQLAQSALDVINKEITRC